MKRESQRSSRRSVPSKPASPTQQQARWLSRGLDQPGGKLPLFDRSGQRISSRVVRSCVRAGWAEPWFANPLKPDWEICRLTDAGRAVLAEYSVVKVDFRAPRPRSRRDWP